MPLLFRLASSIVGLALVVANCSAQTVVVGVLEDSRDVRVLFHKEGNVWKNFPADCDSQRCLSAITSQYPPEVMWTIAFDGRNIGAVTGQTPSDFGSYSDVGLQEIASKGPVPTIGKRSLEYSGFVHEPVYRPLVAVSQPNFKDPESWKRTPAPDEIVKLIRQEFRKKFPTVNNCKKITDEESAPWQYQDHDIKILKTYSSNRHWFLARVRLSEYRCDGPDEEAFLDYSFAVSPTNEVTLLGAGLWLVDAGDYDQDGKSELVFAIDRYDAGGYELYYNDFKAHATFSFGYH
jgi:hypothetical protein